MTCSLTLLSIDVAAGRIAARHRARITHLRAGSCAVAGAHVGGFASMLLIVLPMRSAEKSENSSRINRVTLLPIASFVTLVLTGRGEDISRLRYHQCKCGNSTWQWVFPTVEKGRSSMH